MSAARVLLWIALAAGTAWGGLLSFAAFGGRLPVELARRSLPQAARAGPTHPTEACDCTAQPAAAPAAPPAPAQAPVPRFAVCDREEGPPALSQLPGLLEGRASWSLSCGSSIHVIAIEDSAQGLRPQRILQLDASSPSPAEAPRAVALAAADLDGDRHVDLLAPVLLVDAQGSPRGGMLALLRARPQGGFDAPSHVIDLAPGAVAPARLDAEPGQDLALLQLGDAQLARDSELWTLHGGPSPLRTATHAVGVGTAALAAADLDGDGLDEIAVASERDNRARLFRAQDGAGAAPLSFALPSVREAFAADLNGDGANDIVLVGTRIWVLLARGNGELAPRELAATEGLRDLHAIDVDGDGKLDLVGYAHPELIALLQRDGLSFERRPIATLSGDAGVLFARVGQLGGTAAPDALIVTLSRDPQAKVEIALVRDFSLGARVVLADAGISLPDAALVERFRLR